MSEYKTIYEHFGCNSKEELFRELEIESPKVKELIDLYQLVSQKANITLDEKDVVDDFIRKHNLYPPDDTNIVLLLDAKLHLTDVAVFKTEKEYIDICSRPWGMRNIIIANDSELSAKLAGKVKHLNPVDDRIAVKYDNILNKMTLQHNPSGEWTYIFTDITGNPINPRFKTENEIREIVNTLSYQHKNIRNLIGADETVKECYLHKLKSETLNIHKDKEKIKDYLLKGYKHMGNEYSLVIGIDKKGNISEVNEISVGSGNAAPVDCRAVVRTLNRNHFVILAHNHPSGSLTPSKDDINLTRNIMELANHTKGKVYDHYIIGNQVNEFSNDRSVSDDMKNKMKNYHMLQKSRGR